MRGQANPARNAVTEAGIAAANLRTKHHSPGREQSCPGFLLATIRAPTHNKRMNYSPRPFTKENASEMGKRSGEARKRMKERLRSLQNTIGPEALNDRVQTVCEQIERIDTKLRTCRKARDIVSLVVAKQKLLDCWAMLTGFPKPGTRKGRGALQPGGTQLVVNGSASPRVPEAAPVASVAPEQPAN